MKKHTSNNIRIWKGGEMMKLVCLMILASLLLATAACATTTYTQVVYPAPGYPSVWDTGFNHFALKGVPLDPTPTSVFAGMPIGTGDAGLGRWDEINQGPVNYDPDAPEAFGGMLLGVGYTLAVNPNDADPNGTWTVSYDGVDDGIPDGVGQMTDMWISLPGLSGGDNGGMHWVGHPFDHDVLWTDVQVTDGTQTVSVQDAIGLGWLEGGWTYWDAVNQGPMTIDPDDEFGQYMHPGMMYLVPTLANNIALIIPAD